VQLLQRSTRMLKLTDVGQGYYARCKRILEYEEANREAGDAQQTVHGVLRVAAPTAFGAMHPGGVLADYLAAHPDVTVETTLSDRYLPAVGIDVAVRIGRLQDSDLMARRLAPCRMVFCAAPSFVARHGVPKGWNSFVRCRGLRSAKRSLPAIGHSPTRGGDKHVIDSLAWLAANNMQMLSKPRADTTRDNCKGMEAHMGDRVAKGSCWRFVRTAASIFESPSQAP
jgi:DNA-binding transcriptional LysR family regulator